MDTKSETEKIAEEGPLNKAIKKFVLEHPEIASVALTLPALRGLPQALSLYFK